MPRRHGDTHTAQGPAAGGGEISRSGVQGTRAQREAKKWLTPDLRAMAFNLPAIASNLEIKNWSSPKPGVRSVRSNDIWPQLPSE